MRYDLHMHSTCSDGVHSPAEVVERAIAGGLDAIALTDHDNTMGVRPALEAAKGRITVIPGVEMSSKWEGRSIHILGYFVDPGAEAIDAHYRAMHEARHGRMSAIVQRLADQGVHLDLDRVGEQRAGARVPYTRPHLGRALVRAGHARDLNDAFDRFIGNHCPAYVVVPSPTPGDVTETIQAAGGVAVWAHPPIDLLDELLPELVERGLGGLEAHRPWQARTRDAVLERARRHGLAVTGGSDWHGRDDDPALGSFWVSEASLADFLRLGQGAHGRTV